MSFSEIAQVAKAGVDGYKAVKETVDTVESSIDSVQNELSTLSNQVQGSLDGAFAGLKLDLKSAMFSKELDGFLGELNPLVEVFTLLSDGGPKNASEFLAEKLVGDDMLEIMNNPASTVILQNIEMKRPGFLFRLCMDSEGIKNMTDIPLQTKINVRYHNFSQQVVDFMDRSLSISQVLPDPTITGISVDLRDGSKKGDVYTRAFTGGRFVFRNAEGRELLMKDIATLTITKKDGDADRRKLWTVVRNRIDSSTNIEKRLSDPKGLEQYTDYQKDKAAKVLDAYSKLSYAEKLSPGGNINAGCYMTAFNLAKKTWNFDIGNSGNPTAVETNNTKSEDKNCLSYIPQLIKDRQLPPGTVFWIKQDPTIHDPNSLSREAGNHWFTFSGYVKDEGGNDVPYFVDQFGYGNITRMKGSYPKRFFHKAFVPPAAQ